MRLFAFIDEAKAGSHTRHFEGFPREVTGGKDYRKSFPWPRVIIIEETPDGIFLIRYTQDGSFCGDTWHLNIKDAKKQAKSEYGNLLEGWQQMPEDIIDPIPFILKINQ